MKLHHHLASEDRKVGSDICASAKGKGKSTNWSSHNETKISSLTRTTSVLLDEKDPCIGLISGRDVQ